MATKKELKHQIKHLRKFLDKQRAKWTELNPQEKAHYESVDDYLQKLEQEEVRIEEFEKQPEFRNQRLLRGIGSIALNFLPSLRVFKGLRGDRGGEERLPAPNTYEGEYEILGETDLRPIEDILSLPMGPPAPEGHIPISLPPIKNPPPVDFEQPVMGPGALPDNAQNYLAWQDKTFKELPRNPTPDQFLSAQEPFLDMHTEGLQKRLNLNPSQVKRIKTNFKDTVRAHYDMFNIADELNSPSGVAERVAREIEDMADKLVKQAGNVGIGSLSDARFEALAIDPNYAVNIGTPRPLVPDNVFTSEIDPVFLSNSPLRQFLIGRKKGALDPTTVLDELGIELTDKGVGFKNMDNRGFNTQAIDSGVANLLRNRMRSGETVTKEELLRVLDHHRGQFSTELAFGNDTAHQNAGYGDLLRVAEAKYERGTRSPEKNTDFEIVSKYRPVLEEGGRLGNSPFSLSTGSSHNWASDDIGDQHFWVRGEVVEYPDDLKGGVVGEIQADMGWADSPKKSGYAWLSDMVSPESDEITDIQNREEIFEAAYGRALEEDASYDIRKGDKFPLLYAVRDISSGRSPPTYTPLSSWIEPAGTALSDLNPAFGEEFKALHDTAKEFAIGGAKGRRFDNVLLDKQPFAKEFGIELTKEDLDIPLSDLGIRPKTTYYPWDGVGDQLEFTDKYVKALRSRLLEKYPDDFGDFGDFPQQTAFQQGMKEVSDLMFGEYEYAMDGLSKDFYELFTEEALGPLFKERPALEELYKVGQNAPT